MNNQIVGCLTFFFGEAVLNSQILSKWFDAAQDDREPPELPNVSSYYQKQFLELFALLYPSWIKTHFFIKNRPTSITLMSKYQRHMKRTTQSEQRLKSRILSSKSK